MQVKKLIEQRNRCKSLKEKANLTLEIAFYFTEQGDHASALGEYTRLLDLWRSMDNKPQCAICHRFLADCYIELGEFDQAIKNTNHYLQLSIENDDKVEQQRAFVTLGRCFLNRAEQMKDGREIMVNLKSASQAFISSIKLISDLTTLLDVCQLGEMRAVSLLNLGQVLRGLRDHASAKERFLQCVSLARKYGLHKLLFRACYQLYDMAVSATQLSTIAPCSRSFFLEQLNKSPLHKALEVVRLALRSSLSKSCSDTESKDLLRNLKEAYANIYLALGQFRKAAKVYRLLKLDSPMSSDVCRKFIQKSILLSDQMQSLPEATPVSVEEFISVSKKHERLGDLYTCVELHGPALLHYQFMLSYAEHAYQLILTKSGSAMLESDTTVKLVDAALVSVAEAHRTLGDYDQCAQVYKREIQWSTSKGLSTADLAGSWFSLAQAQRLCFPTFSTSAGDCVVIGSECTLNTLTSALQASKQSGSMKLTKEILFEIQDYCKCHNLSEQAASLQKELSNYTQDSSPEQLDSSQLEEAPEYSDDTVVDEDLVTQFIEALSSDSEVESCVGHVEILDELHGERRGTRKGRALCLKTNMKGETPLHVAAIHGDMDHVMKLIEVLSHPVNVVDGAGWLPIHEAAFHDRTEVAVYLLDRGARLDDPGCPLDASTPLFEAVHNGSLTTALMLVRRGANLWHRNKRGECLPELLDSWQPTRRCVGTFGQQREVFDQLLNAIRERLGRDYDRWCNQPRSSPRDHASTSSSPTSSHGSPSNTILPPPRVKHRRQPRSPSLSDLDGRADKPHLHRDLRCQDWEELLVDLDATQSTSSYVRKGVNRNTRKPDAVQAYKEAMQAIASSSSRSKKRTVSESQRECSPKHRKKRATAQIVMEDENWLVNDECPSASKQKTNRTVRSQLELRNVQLSDKPAIKSGTASAAVGGSRTAPLCDISHLQNTSVDFSSYAAVFTSTQMPSDSTSKTTSTPPPPQPHSSTLSAQPVSAVTGVVPSLSAVRSVERADRMPPRSQPVQSAQGTHGPFSFKVAFTDISVLVPVDDSSRSVSWLANEAYRRRQILTSSTCSTTPDRANCVRLSTRDGALLLPTDRLLSVVPGLNQSGQVIELLAELIGETAGPPTPLLHPPAVAPKLIVGLSTSYNTSLGHVQVGAEIPGDGGRCGLIVSSQFFKTLLERSRQTSILDLRYLALGDVECCLIVTQVVRHGVRSISELYLQGNGLQLSLPSSDTSSSARHSPLSVTISQLATQVTRLDLDSNAISFHGLMQFLDQLNQIVNTGSDSTRTVLLPRLQRVSLAHNWFLGASDGKVELEDHDSDFNWLNLIGRFVVAFPKLAHLNLSGCGLGLKQNPCGRTVTLPPSPVSNLSELDLSWNPHLASESLFTVLSSGCLAGLRSLSLRGCSLPVNQKTLLTTLPVTSAQVTASRWLTSAAKKQDVLTTNLSSPLPSSGDGIVRTLSTVILQGLFRLQRLDLGYCQLTNHCLTDLTTLFDTPGTSLTTIQLDHNPDLTGHISPGWSDILRATALPSSALVSLTIDMPNVNDDSDDSLAAAIAAVEVKLLPGLCSTPLQELILDGAPCDWHPPKPLMNIGLDRVKQGAGKFGAFPNSHRFCNALTSLFTARFGSLANHKIGQNRICFGIL